MPELGTKPPQAAPKTTPIPTTTTTAGAVAAPAPIQVMGLDRVEAEINRSASQVIGDLPTIVSSSGKLSMPSADLEMIKKTLPNGKDIDYERTIADTNPDVNFAFLSHEMWSKDPDFRAGYIPVNEAHGLNIPKRHFGADGFIRMGEMLLYVARKEYADNHRAKYDKKMNFVLGATSAGVTQGEVKGPDGLEGSVISRGEETTLGAVDMKELRGSGGN